ncbi:unnamed protein product [Urochloa decumbens]|uniref:Uncharacterized protein n=1 Tax=Urochloa decumbens TaxID=240449 RepID=A0ABC8VIA3_9POAL
MRGKATEILIAVFFVGCLVTNLPAQCRRDPQLLGPPEAEGVTERNTSATASSSSDQKKLTLIFCHEKTVCPFPPCFCCIKPDTCYNTWEECQAHCFVCNPICPPQIRAKG